MLLAHMLVPVIVSSLRPVPSPPPPSSGTDDANVVWVVWASTKTMAMDMTTLVRMMGLPKTLATMIMHRLWRRKLA